MTHKQSGVIGKGRDLFPQMQRALLGIFVLGAICSFSNLTAVAQGPFYHSFIGPDVTDQTVKSELKSLPTVRRVKFNDTSAVTDAAFADVAALKDLQWVDVVKATFNGSGIDHLSKAPKLRQLDLMVCPIVDDNLKWLASLKLTTLSLRECPITNRGAWYVSFVSTLENVDLCDTLVGDKGVAYLERLPKLRLLYLLQTKITDAVADSLCTFQNLEVIDIRNTAITDVTVRKIADLPKVKQYMIGAVGVTNAGVAALQGHRTVEHLLLSNASITDEMLPVLLTMPSLKFVEMYTTAITPEGVARIKKQRPNMALFITRTGADAAN